jgi:hypothetical protein
MTCGRMETSAETYLYTLATLAITFVGFSALVIIFRQTIGGEMSRLDVLLTRIFIQLGFMVAAGAMVPELLSLFHLPSVAVWRISSIAAAVPAFLFAVTYPRRRRKSSGVATPLVIWINVFVLLAAAGVLGCNAVGLGFEPGAGPFAAALTAILFLSGWAYLQALSMLLRPHFNLRGPEVTAPKSSKDR